MVDVLTVDPFDRTSLGDQVAERLRGEILSGRVAPGARLNLEDYKVQWDISITPLRDAAKRLEADGLVTIVPRRGVFVATIDKRALFEIFEIRIALEPLIAERATPQVPEDEVQYALEQHLAAGRIQSEEKRTKRLQGIDHLIHDLVLKHCPNGRLVRIVSGLRDSIIWCQNTVQRSVPHAFEPSLEEHIAICEALLTKDGQRVHAAMKQHLLATRARAADALQGWDQP